MITIVLAITLLSACTAQRAADEIITSMPAQESGEEAGSAQAGEGTGPSAGERPMLADGVAKSGETDVTPCVEAYTIAPDLGNVDNLRQFYLEDGIIEQLARNGFVVCGDAGNEFFEIYEINRYGQIPNFVTVDSLMHTYHLYFSCLLKNIERNYLSERLVQLSRKMLDNSTAQYEQLKNSEWESAAARNAAFFTIGANLLGEDAAVNDYTEDIVKYELDRISQADGIYPSQITGEEEDYTQYAPRGYYEGDEKLEKYFKAMMWYGRIHFRQEHEEMNRSALLLAKALWEDPEGYQLWESIYAVTSFFAGASDDLGVCEYAPVIREAYGDEASIETLITDKAAFDRFHAMTARLSPPRINSIPAADGQDHVILGFRFMGQRFTIDAAIMQKLIYSNVEKNAAGELRMLPDVLDVPAALGSDAALRILEEKGALDFAGYQENMNQLRKALSEENEALWSASLYAGWLNTLRPLLTPRGEGYPIFMQSEEWVKKNLECFAGSFTELKHDTVLYSKQVIAEMGGDYEENIDYRGYVEPEPLVYERFASLADRTAQGLKRYGMLASSDEENLSRLFRIAGQLQEISNKELGEEALTEEEYEFIECYGGTIEHFWYETVKDENADIISTKECPAAVVVDIATNPGGAVLEAATENPSTIYVVVKVDGMIKLARGSVFSFYQFAWPLDDRLTDAKWRQMTGIQADEDGNYNFDIPVQKPDWTESYRYRYEWE